jgi:hypothetical protein
MAAAETRRPLGGEVYASQTTNTAKSAIRTTTPTIV